MLVDDLRRVAAAAAARGWLSAETRVVLVGHSMGGAIAIRAAAQVNPVHCVLVCLAGWRAGRQQGITYMGRTSLANSPSPVSCAGRQQVRERYLYLLVVAVVGTFPASRWLDRPCHLDGLSRASRRSRTVTFQWAGSPAAAHAAALSMKKWEGRYQPKWLLERAPSAANACLVVAEPRQGRHRQCAASSEWGMEPLRPCIDEAHLKSVWAVRQSLTGLRCSKVMPGRRDDGSCAPR